MRLALAENSSSSQLLVCLGVLDRVAPTRVLNLATKTLPITRPRLSLFFCFRAAQSRLSIPTSGREERHWKVRFFALVGLALGTWV